MLKICLCLLCIILLQYSVFIQLIIYCRNWPIEGLVKFDNYSTRYRPELNLVIKNLNIEVKPKEKIGIVGRTGAGKSSLTLSLFRLIEAAQGSIIIDGVDISYIGLHELRNRVTILPQVSVVISYS